MQKNRLSWLHVVSLCAALCSSAQAVDYCAENEKNALRVTHTWGEDSKEHDGGSWILGGRANQQVVALELSRKRPRTELLVGTITYAGEGPIAVSAEPTKGKNCYRVWVSWGDSNQYYFDGFWRIGGRDEHVLYSINVKAEGSTLKGQVTYAAEGPIGFSATRNSNTYAIVQLIMDTYTYYVRPR